MARKKKDWVPKQGNWEKKALGDAVQHVKRGTMSKFKASRVFGIPRTTLSRRLLTMDLESPASKPTILSKDEENSLVGHILEMEERGFGLTITDVCKLAYSIMSKSGRKNPFNEEKKMAGYDWWQGFRDRHPCLSLRKPEGLSAARGTMLNPNVITEYFTKLGDLMDRLNIKSKPQQIFNADETGFSTVHQTSKVVGRKGKKAIHAKTSGERGENITVLCCVNAEAHVLPPMVIFKGKRISQALMSNAPKNTLFACSKSSFIDGELFGMWFEKIFLPNISPQRPVLLIVDGHASHITIHLLEAAKANDVEIFCLPPHTTHWTQPLDRGVFGPLKKAYYKHCESFLKQNPSRQISRYDFCGIFSNAYNEKMNMVNIFGGFRATGIFPFNPLAIPPEAFGPSKTSSLVSLTNSTSKEEVPPRTDNSSAEKMPVAEQVSSRSSTVSKDISELLQLPTVYKEPAQRKTKRVLGAKCLTENEFINELKQREEKRVNEEKEKELRKKEREAKRQKKEMEKLKKQLDPASTFSKSTKTKRRPKATTKENVPSQTITREEEDPSNCCTYCGGCYFDDDSDDEDWIKCTQCDDWYHESCTGKFGCQLDQFVCEKH
uniref:Uncharacterized protein LOC111106665 n=1 Tax=Crassostrea virginica TaxID=6565 RepID=A0A8B8B154_CRAVI|nr:uncharacterized protein LOC111106665 [Crassostrea virginica]